MRLIIDADPIVYRSGFAAEKNDLEVVAEDEKGKLYPLAFRADEKQTAKDKLDAHFAKHPGHAPLYQETNKRVLCLRDTLQIVKVTMEAIELAVQRHYGGTVQPSVLLSGPGNYREQIATIAPYKGNRDPEHVPYHYQGIRDYLHKTWGARVIHGREADDEASILAWEERRAGRPYVVASIDKDLDQIPGEHYDYRQHVFYQVSDDDARRAFWIQALAGDPGDNVPGAWRIGYATAEKIVDKLMAAGFDDERIWAEIVLHYRAAGKKAGAPHAGVAPEAAALETAQLVYMQRRPKELWMPPGTEFGTVDGDPNDI